MNSALLIMSKFICPLHNAAGVLSRTRVQRNNTVRRAVARHCHSLADSTHGRRGAWGWAAGRSALHRWQAAVA